MIVVNEGRRIVMEEPSGDEGVGRGQHANEGILAGALSFFFCTGGGAMCAERHKSP